MKPPLHEVQRSTYSGLHAATVGGSAGPPTRLGEYRLAEAIRQDGQTIVYRAHHQSGRLAAVHVATQASDSSEQWEAIRRDAAATARVEHPNLAAVLDVGREGRRVFVVSDFADGPSLRWIVQHSGPAPNARAVRWILSVAEAAGALHMAGLLHRRIQPFHIVVSPHGRAKLLPPRFAALGDEDPNWLRSQFGQDTVQYAAPEQLRGEHNATERSDVYSLAATLYTAVTGRTPFPAASFQECLAKKESGVWTEPSSLVSQLSPVAAEVIRRGLDPDPSKRPASVCEITAMLARDLEVVGRYTLLEQVGHGQSGDIFRGRAADGRIVAVKLPPPEVVGVERRLLRVYQEAKLSMEIDHPALVRAWEVGEHNGRHFIALDYVEGENLARHVMRRGRLSETEALEIVIQVARALQKVHEQAVVHRDVNPANILIGRDGRTMLADLGLSKDRQSDLGLTAEGAALGTLHYAAPEQFHSAKHVGPASDLYGLGATLYAMVTGKLPFDGHSHMERWMAKLKNEYPPPEKVNPEISMETAQLIQSAMHADPKHRPDSAAQFGRLADRCLAACRNRQGVAAASTVQATDVEPQWQFELVSATGRTQRVKATKQQIVRLVETGRLSPKTRASLEGRGPLQPLEELPQFRSPSVGPVVIATRRASQRRGSLASAMRRWLFGDKKPRRPLAGRPGTCGAPERPPFALGARLVRNLAAGLAIAVAFWAVGQFLSSLGV